MGKIFQVEVQDNKMTPLQDSKTGKGPWKVQMHLPLMLYSLKNIKEQEAHDEYTRKRDRGSSSASPARGRGPRDGRNDRGRPPTSMSNPHLLLTKVNFTLSHNPQHVTQ
jgi:hypothetical protein